MAEIHVEKKRGVGGWVWALLAIILIAAVVLYLWQSGYIDLSSASNIVEDVSVLAGGGFNGA